MSTAQIGAQRGKGRPRDAEKDATIRQAAWRVLADKGYEGLTFEAVAEAAGCSRATLYRRFASKVELLTAILYETSRSVEPDIPPGATPRDTLIAHATACADYMSGHRGVAIMSLGVTAARSPELVLALTGTAEHERGFYKREFLRLHPDASDADVDFACHTLIGSVVYLVAILRLALTPRRIAQLVDQAIALLGDPPTDPAPSR